MIKKFEVVDEAGNAQLGFDYATMKVRGVNLGGWLVLERKWLSM